jgi:2-amino-4-hydroxy-6-hydroxymethyldihydropteridine diphosphokinase
MMTYYLSLGANIGNREQTIHQALQMIEQQIGHVLRCSSFYYSAPCGFDSENEFCNICCALETNMEADEVLAYTQQIEKQLGRDYKSDHHSAHPVYRDRTIDIDLILVFDKQREITINTPTLTIPHPHYKERDFVTIPLSEILI